MPEGAALGGRSAAAVPGAPTPAYGDPVTVVLPPPLKWTGPKGVRVHRTEFAEPDVERSIDDLLITSPLRTAWDVAVLETVPTAVGVLDAMLRSGLVTTAGLRELLDRSVGRWGRQRARRAFDHVDARSESPPESWVRVTCALGGLPAPVPQFDVVDDGTWLARVDLAWPEAEVVVEYEGEHHVDGLRIVRDDARLGRLVAAGWTIVRLSAADLRSMDEVVRRIRDALGVAPRELTRLWRYPRKSPEPSRGGVPRGAGEASVHSAVGSLWSPSPRGAW